MINAIQPPISGALTETLVIKPVAMPAKDIEVNKLTTSSDTANISLFARQLNESAERAGKRDASMSRSQLADFARRIESRLAGDDYEKNKDKHNLEIPNTDDPEWLARAKQATQFLTCNSTEGSTGKSPFAALSREQLSLIAYDEGGSYTVNERRAAWSTAHSMESAWRMKVGADGWNESLLTGKKTNFYTELLTHYRSLPLIEQARYPEDYEGRLQGYIDEAENGQEPEEFDPLTLLQVIARLHQPENETKKPDEPEAATESKTSSVSPEAYRSSPTTSLG